MKTSRSVALCALALLGGCLWVDPSEQEQMERIQSAAMIRNDVLARAQAAAEPPRPHVTWYEGWIGPVHLKFVRVEWK